MHCIWESEFDCTVVHMYMYLIYHCIAYELLVDQYILLPYHQQWADPYDGLTEEIHQYKYIYNR